MSSRTLSRGRNLHSQLITEGVSDGSAARTPPTSVAKTDGGASPGRYRYDPRTDSWWWSWEMFALLDLVPGSTQPCTELLVSPQRPSDRQRTLGALTGAYTDGRAFALEAQIIRPDGLTRDLVLTGEPCYGSDGGVTAVEGLCIDLTAGRRITPDERVRQLETELEQLRTAMASRAGIEQAKGILMLLIGCGDQIAFDMLKYISSYTHRKLRDVAQAITESASGRGGLPEDVRLILRDVCPPQH